MIIKFLKPHKGDYFTISDSDPSGTARNILLDGDSDAIYYILPLK